MLPTTTPEMNVMYCTIYCVLVSAKRSCLRSFSLVHFFFAKITCAHAMCHKTTSLVWFCYFMRKVSKDQAANFFSHMEEIDLIAILQKDLDHQAMFIYLHLKGFAEWPYSNCHCY